MTYVDVCIFSLNDVMYNLQEHENLADAVTHNTIRAFNSHHVKCNSANIICMYMYLHETYGNLQNGCIILKFSALSVEE